MWVPLPDVFADPRPRHTAEVEEADASVTEVVRKRSPPKPWKILGGTGEHEKMVGIGAWTLLGERHYEHWDAGREEQEEPWFGWLSNSVPGYPETLVLRGEELRPLIRLQPTDHPLAVDQRDGITLARARELSAQWLHA
jgi:hypothetical protein